MPLLKAQSISMTVRAWLNDPHHARILHLFDTAINLTAGDRVISIVTPAIGDGPFNIVVSPINFTHHTTTADPVCLSPTEIRIGALTVDLSTATIWNPRPDWDELRRNGSKLAARAVIIREVLRDHAAADSLAGVVIEVQGKRLGVDEQFIEAARGGWDEMYRGAISVDQEACAAGSRKLIGLGKGLTPAGDDWLLGCALAAHTGFPSPDSAAVLLKAIGANVRGTTPLSAGWLGAAVDGACGERWHAFFAGCLVGDDQGVYEAAAEIVRQGHSSGADSMAGYLATLAVWR